MESREFEDLPSGTWFLTSPQGKIVHCKVDSSQSIQLNNHRCNPSKTLISGLSFGYPVYPLPFCAEYALDMFLEAYRGDDDNE